MDAEAAAERAKDFLARMGFRFVQVVKTQMEDGTWVVVADVGYTRRRIARMVVNQQTGRVEQHEVED